MRLGARSQNEFIQTLNQKNDEIQRLFLDRMKALTETTDVKVMMGDATVTQQKTFDPKQVSGFFQKMVKSLEEWSIQDVSVSNNEDIRRVFTKFEVREGNYLISGHVSIQFHVLLYYKPDQRVVDCQKELSVLIDTTKSKEQQMSDDSDQVVLDKLKEKGYKDFDHQKLFEIFYENDEFRERVYEEIEKDTGQEFKELSERKKALFDELDSLLMETYQTSPVLIDDSRLVNGEEGMLCTIDIEFMKDGGREGLFDPRKIPESVQKQIRARVDEIMSNIAA